MALFCVVTFSLVYGWGEGQTKGGHDDIFNGGDDGGDDDVYGVL